MLRRVRNCLTLLLLLDLMHSTDTFAQCFKLLYSLKKCSQCTKGMSNADLTVWTGCLHVCAGRCHEAVLFVPSKWW